MVKDKMIYVYVDVNEHFKRLVSVIDKQINLEIKIVLSLNNFIVKSSKLY